MKQFLNVPFEEKDIAKKLGAKWDPLDGRWYAPNGEKALISRWPYLYSDITELVDEIAIMAETMASPGFLDTK